jgi:hypothetical protein
LVRVGCATKRAVADTDPYAGVAVHDTSPECESRYEAAGAKHVAHWCTIGGTSLAAPPIASVFALAGGADGVAHPAKTLYDNELKSPGSWRGPGYDGPTGVGTPAGIADGGDKTFFPGVKANAKENWRAKSQYPCSLPKAREASP